MTERNFRSAWTAATWAVLGVSLALRSVLVAHGGQQFWPDEDRFEFCRTAAADLLGGQFMAAARVVFGSADHILFRACAIVPALAENVFRSGPWLPGLFFAVVSTAVLWAAGLLARAAGGDERERFFTVLAAASCASLFYYSRHFVPYDLSLFFFLIALSRVMRPRRDMWSCICVGLWSACGFLAYNGYWTLVPVAAGLFLATATTGRSFIRSATGFGAGFLVPNVAVIAIGRWLGFDLVASYSSFSSTTVQGNLDQAWRFIGEYFCQAEGINVLIYAAAVCVTVWAAFSRRGVMGGIYAALITMVLYGLIVLGSDVFLKIAVAARHVRVIAPFCAWTVGASLAWIAGRCRWGTGIAAACSILMVCAAAKSFYVPLTQVFPRDFGEAARSAIMAGRSAGEGLQPLQMQNNWFLHNPGWNQPIPSDARVRWSRPHPFAYGPYLFEGYDEARRAAYIQGDLSMRVLRFEGAAPIPGYPYAFKLSFIQGAQDALNEGRPIVSSGSTGRGDVIFLLYQPDETARIGLDHWGRGSSVSETFSFKRGIEHTLVVIAPCLVGGAPKDSEARHRIEHWSHRVYVEVDGTPVMNVAADFYPSDERSVTIGLNLIHASSARTSIELSAVHFSALQDSDWARAEFAR
jgi:hypothetical protein